MALSFVDFISQAMAQPSLFVILILVIGVTAVSGATDAPNAIATVVSTRCLKPSVAIGLAAVFNFVGLVGMTYISTAVAKTMFGMVDFSGNTDAALYALMAAMIGAILWGIFCWFFGIPCSKSHSLIAGVTGGAIALNGLAGVVPAEWAKVIYGMVFSLVAGFFLGWLFVKVIEKACTHVNRQAANHAFTGIQDVCAVALSFLHGAQDGQKFMSIAMLGVALSFGNPTPDSNGFPMWLMIICSLAISLGTPPPSRCCSPVLLACPFPPATATPRQSWASVPANHSNALTGELPATWFLRGCLLSPPAALSASFLPTCS